MHIRIKRALTGNLRLYEVGVEHGFDVSKVTDIKGTDITPIKWIMLWNQDETDPTVRSLRHEQKLLYNRDCLCFLSNVTNTR